MKVIEKTLKQKIKEKGFLQKFVALKMNMNEVSFSFYVNKKRKRPLGFEEKVLEIINK